MFKFLRRAAVLGVVSLAPLAAFAGGNPYDPLINAIDFTDVGPVVYGAAGALAAILVIIKGVKFGLSLIR
jgi:hypothetical protein